MALAWSLLWLLCNIAPCYRGCFSITIPRYCLAIVRPPILVSSALRGAPPTKGFGMYKSLIAGVTAFALAATAASPIQAQSTDQDAFAKFLFGLVAAAAVGSAIKNRRSNNDRNAPPELIAPEHNTHSPGDDRNRGRRNLRRQDSPSDNRNWNNPGRALGHRRDATLLQPAVCVQRKRALGGIGYSNRTAWSVNFDMQPRCPTTAASGYSPPIGARGVDMTPRVCAATATESAGTNLIRIRRVSGPT